MSKRRYRRPVWADEFEAAGHKIGPDGTIVVYHATTAAKAKKILEEGFLRRPADAPDSYGVYFSISPEVAENYGDGTLVKLRVPVEHLGLDDIFPSGRMDFHAQTHGGVYVPLALEVIPAGGVERGAEENPRNFRSTQTLRAWASKNRSDLTRLTGKDLEAVKREADFYNDQYASGEPGSGAAADFDWYVGYVPFSVLGNRRSWASWMREELDDPDAKRMWGWLLHERQDEEDPIIVVEDADEAGDAALWDGNHRTGAAAIAGRKSVFAFVGLRPSMRKIGKK